MILCMIAAMSENHVIWANGTLPRHYREDLQRFKVRTAGNVVIMWRWTYESIGKPLPNRRNIVISSTATYPEVECYNDPETALAILEQELWAEDEVFVIWWASLYGYFMKRAERLYLTEVKHVVEGDTFFPPFKEHFEEVERQIYDSDLDFVIYRKKRID